MGKAIFPWSSANVKTWVSDKMAKDFNSSAPVESLFPANAMGSLQLPREDERRGSELGSRRTSWISIKARYDDPPKRDWGDEAYYRSNKMLPRCPKIDHTYTNHAFTSSKQEESA
ncbi:uncharacterized protein LOC131303802 [Rhododendron vialii]|uniref:uncharacterized protein LOC131303802 n=1 Tax=Rhododendron vialii TaxID=182163 RepID=UPI00265E5658|nr:uncharacterized protein LOC131303802 [Rhododendron vialii]